MGKYAAAFAAMAALVLGSFPSPAQPPAWDPQPWLGDLALARAAIETKYANLEWQLTERELDLAGLFDRAGAALRQAGSDAQAMAVFDRLVGRIGDGHVGISWPRPGAPAPAVPAAAAAPPGPPPTPAAFCRAHGFERPRNYSGGIGPALAGYSPIEAGDLLPAGTVPLGGARAGIVRIAKFEPGDSPALCIEALAALAVPLDRPCDEGCRDRILTRVYAGLTAALDDRLTRLRAARATVLIVDITNNGGGSEWAEAAARMLSRRELVSARLGFVRGPHWTGTWTRLAGRLRGHARTASRADRRRLLAWAAEADAARAEAGRTCPPAGGCAWLGRGGFATGLVGHAAAGAFAGRDWAPWVFTPAQYPYRDGAWDGPVVVLVDEGTASAAEQFAALLQDNRAAFVVGGRTGGSGCGHTWGGTPTRLPHSGAILELPDCARFRADGSNEVRGIVPDQLLPWRANDGRGFRARMLEAALPGAAERAAALYRNGASR